MIKPSVSVYYNYNYIGVEMGKCLQSDSYSELRDNEGGGGLPSEAKIVYSYLRFMIIVIVITFIVISV